MIPGRARFGWPGLAGLTGAAALALLLPLELPPGGAGWTAASRSFHGLLFAGLAWVWGRSLPVRWRGAPLWAGLMLLAAGAEIAQSWLGRTGEWPDWVCGTAGAGVVCASWHWEHKVRARLMAVGLVCFSPLGWGGYLYYQEARAFPVLMVADSVWAETGWQLNAVRLQRSPGQGLRIAPADADTAYPGLFRAPARKDWRGAQGISLTLYWPDEHPAILAIRADDRPENPAYADRFQQEFTVTQGWNRVWIAGKELARTSGGRPMEMGHIRQWGVFLVSAAAFDYVLMGEVRLELP
jgi:hypothetical protein